MNGEVGAWKVLCDLPRGRAGLHLVKTRAIGDSEGNLCVGKTVSLCHWQEHFEATVNICSEYEKAAVQSSDQCSIRRDYELQSVVEDALTDL